MRFTKENAAEYGVRSKRGLSERSKILNDLFDPEKAKAVFEKLQALALTGDMEAMKVFLAYCFGKPKESMDITSDGEKIGGYHIEIMRTNANAETAN